MSRRSRAGSHVRASGRLEGFSTSTTSPLACLPRQDEPADRRIQATVYDLFQASASLMLDNSSTRLAAVSSWPRNGATSWSRTPWSCGDRGPVEGRARPITVPNRSRDARLRASVGLTAPAVELDVARGRARARPRPLRSTPRSVSLPTCPGRCRTTKPGCSAWDEPTPAGGRAPGRDLGRQRQDRADAPCPSTASGSPTGPTRHARR